MRTGLWVAALVVLLIGAASAAAPSRGTQMVIEDATQSEKIMDALENAVWIADGAEADKQVYVIFSTECAYCQQFFNDTRSKVAKVQLRWIAHCCNDSALAILESRSVDAIAHAYARKAQPVNDRARAARTLVVNQWAAKAVSDSLIYPMLIYRTAQGLVVNFGLPPDLDAMFAVVMKQSEQAQHQPASLVVLNQPLVLTPADNMKSYYNRSGKPLALYAQPDFAAQKVSLNIPADYGYQVIGFANDGWIVVKGLLMPDGSYVPAYIHAPTDIALSRLKFTVRPVRGVVVAQTRALEIRLHPDLNSPVVDRLEPGSQMDKTGEVILAGKTWAQVQVYTDGTKGYILR
ncbi:MAG: hypothetical protein LBV36_00750 [Chromatiales bacterium]|jgi:hypothetical protein|nr:hypothetical protein [Chromatiales bacterium]